MLLFCKENIRTFLVVDELIQCMVSQLAEDEEGWIVHFDRNQDLFLSHRQLIILGDRLKRVRVKYPCSLKEVAEVLLSVSDCFTKPKFIIVNNLLSFWKNKIDDKLVGAFDFLLRLLSPQVTQSVQASHVIIVCSFLPQDIDSKLDLNTGLIVSAINRIEKVLLIEERADDHVLQVSKLIGGLDFETGLFNKVYQSIVQDWMLDRICQRVDSSVHKSQKEIG